MEVLKKACKDGDFESFLEIFPSLQQNYGSANILSAVKRNCPDDPKWVDTFDPSFYTNLLLEMIERDAKKIVSYLVLQKGFSVNYTAYLTVFPLDGAQTSSMCRLLIDLGAVELTKTHWCATQCNTAISNRHRCRHSALITLCASRCRSRIPGMNRDILQIIAPKAASPRCVWSARLTESFWFE